MSKSLPALRHHKRKTEETREKQKRAIPSRIDIKGKVSIDEKEERYQLHPYTVEARLA